MALQNSVGKIRGLEMKFSLGTASWIQMKWDIIRLLSSCFLVMLRPEFNQQCFIPSSPSLLCAALSAGQQAVFLFVLLTFFCKTDFSNCVNMHCFKTRFVFCSSNRPCTNRQWSSLLNWKLRGKKEKLKKCMKGTDSILLVQLGLCFAPHTS